MTIQEAMKRPIQFGSQRAIVTGASWDTTAQRAFIVYINENGEECTTRAMGMTIFEVRQAVLDEMMNIARCRQ